MAFTFTSPERQRRLNGQLIGAGGWDTLPHSGFYNKYSESKTGTTYNLTVEMSGVDTIKNVNGVVVATPGPATVAVPTTTVPLPLPPGF